MLVPHHRDGSLGSVLPVVHTSACFCSLTKHCCCNRTGYCRFVSNRMAMLVVSLLLVRVSEPSKNAPWLEMSKNPPKFDLTRLPKFEVPRPADWARAMLHTLETIQPHRPARRHWSDSIRLPMLIISVSALIARLTKPKEASGDWLLRWACRIIYACTVINPFFSVLADDYTFIHDAASS